MLVAFDEDLIDPSKVSFIGKITERMERKNGQTKTFTMSVMFKYIVDGIVLSVVRETMDIPADDENAKAEMLKPVQTYISMRRRNLAQLVADHTSKPEA